MNATHTPGPWNTSKLASPDYCPQFGVFADFDANRDLAIVKGERAKADAALIATAPELLTALREIAERGPVDGYTSAAALRLRLMGIQTIARAAIAKATA
jgi:hypothetical protein